VRWNREEPRGTIQFDGDLWFQHAREFLGETNYLPHLVTIVFNRWFSDINYRVEIAERLRIPFDDDLIDIVDFNGSSFDGMRFQDDAQKWYDVVSRADVQEYSERIFGFNPLKDLGIS